MRHEPVCTTPSMRHKGNHQPPFRLTDRGFQFGLLHCLPGAMYVPPKVSAACQVNCHFFPS